MTFGFKDGIVWMENQMRLTSEREKQIRDACLRGGAITKPIFELLDEIDRLRSENAQQYLNLTAYAENEGWIEEERDELIETLRIAKVGLESAWTDYDKEHSPLNTIYATLVHINRILSVYE